MPMLSEPSKKYRSHAPITLDNRQWPSKVLKHAPRWLSTDLRDGSQALPAVSLPQHVPADRVHQADGKKPLSLQQKLSFFELLVSIGFKEIEIAIPASSATDYEFTRHLAQSRTTVPDDVWLQVMCPCREPLIRRTVEAVSGAKNAIFHLYISTSVQLRELALGLSEDEAIDLAVQSTKLVRSLTKDDPSSKTQWKFQLGLEAFQDTPLDFSLRLCEAVKEAWGPSEACPIIFTLAATVEAFMPNRFADQIEYFSTHISEREKVAVCVHPHNDRGCAIAAAEQAQLAGADRVEGCLLGNGERTGNVDLVTLALNLYCSGISPGLDLSNLKDITERVSGITNMSVYPRAPYTGSLVFCTFAGSHQDAIKKSFAAGKTSNSTHWAMPYLPIDPSDIGRVDEPVIRITSQSGKAGAAWIIESTTGLCLPRGLQAEFAPILQKEAETTGRELSHDEVVALFERRYRLQNARKGGDTGAKSPQHFIASVAGVSWLTELASTVKDSDANSINELLSKAGLRATVRNTATQKLEDTVAVYVELSTNGGGDYQWSVGLHPCRVEAIIASILNALPASDFQREEFHGIGQNDRGGEQSLLRSTSRDIST